MAKAAPEGLITALDIGSSKVSAMIAQRLRDYRALFSLGWRYRAGHGRTIVLFVALAVFGVLTESFGVFLLVPLLGKGWIRFDMRDPTKFVGRKPGQVVNRAITNPQDGTAPPRPAMIEAKHTVFAVVKG